MKDPVKTNMPKSRILYSSFHLSALRVFNISPFFFSEKSRSQSDQKQFMQAAVGGVRGMGFAKSRRQMAAMGELKSCRESGDQVERFA